VTNQRDRRRLPTAGPPPRQRKGPVAGAPSEISMHGTDGQTLAHHDGPINFVSLQRAYAEHSISVYPLTAEKMPAIRGYDRVGAKGSHQLAMKFPEGLAAGFLAGRRNRLTVVDIDSLDDRLVDEIQARFGTTPFQVRTPSGGCHLYYRHQGEDRRIRPLPDVDVLGAGNVVAALSVVPKGRYQIERGSLDDLAALPPMRRERPQRTAGSIPKGQRNQALFDYCRRTVSHCDDLEQLVDAARTWAGGRGDENLQQRLDLPSRKEAHHEPDHRIRGVYGAKDQTLRPGVVRLPIGRERARRIVLDCGRPRRQPGLAAAFHPSRAPHHDQSGPRQVRAAASQGSARPIPLGRRDIRS
jgi:hypothetical protein